jgi:Ca2+/Na+ antiporter
LSGKKKGIPRSLFLSMYYKGYIHYEHVPKKPPTQNISPHSNHKETHERSHWIIRLVYKIFGYISMFFIFLRNYSIPPCDEESWDRTRACLSIFPGLIIFLLFYRSWIPTDSNSFQFYLIASVGVVLLLIGIIIRCTTEENSLPKHAWAIGIFSILNSLIWITGVTKMLIDFLSFICNEAEIPYAIIGLTCLSFGNSFPDIITYVFLSKCGFPEMAITSCISEPIFNMLLGIGFSTIIFPPNPLSWRNNMIPFCGLAFMLAVQTIFFIYNCVHKFVFHRCVSYLKLGALFTFILSIVALLLTGIISH